MTPAQVRIVVAKLSEMHHCKQVALINVRYLNCQFLSGMRSLTTIRINGGKRQMHTFFPVLPGLHRLASVRFANDHHVTEGHALGIAQGTPQLRYFEMKHCQRISHVTARLMFQLCPYIRTFGCDQQVVTRRNHHDWWEQVMKPQYDRGVHFPKYMYLILFPSADDSTPSASSDSGGCDSD